MALDVVGVKYVADMEELIASTKEELAANIALEKSAKSVGKAYTTMADTSAAAIAEVDMRTKQLKESNLKNAEVVKMLIEREKQLTESRNKSTDPSKIERYNKQLAETAAIIDNEFRIGAQGIQDVSDALGKGGKDVDDFKNKVSGYANAFASAFDTLQQELAQVKSALKDPNLQGAALDELRKKEALLTTVTDGLNKEFTSTRAQAKAFQEATQQIGISMGQASETFQKFRTEVGKGVDDLNDIKDSIKLAASDTGALDQLIGAANGIAGGFAVAEGAVALFAGESEELQKTMVKLQAVLAIVNGLQAVQTELKNKDSAATKALAVMQRLYAIAIGTSTGAMKAFKIALISTGIGAIVVALGLLIANFDAVVGAVKSFIGVSDEGAQTLDEMTDAIERNKQASEAYDKAREIRIGLIKDETTRLREQAALRREQALDEANEVQDLDARNRLKVQIEAQYQADLTKIQEDGDKKREDQRKKDADAAKKLRDARLKMEADYQSLLIENMDEGTDKLIAQENFKYQQRKVSLEGNYKALEQLEIQHQKAIHDIRKEANNTDPIIGKNATGDVKQRQSEINSEWQKGEETRREESNKAQERQLEKQRKKDEEEIENTKNVEQAKSDITRAVVDATFQIMDQQRNAKFNKELSEVDKLKEMELAALEDRSKKEKLTKEETDAAKLEIEEKFAKQEAEIKKKQFQKDKQSAIIQATIATALSVAKLLATPPLAIAAAVLGAAQIAIIASQPEPQFRDGVIDLQGPGTGTSDSIRARLSKGESVMKASETKDYKAELLAIRKGNFEDFIFQTRVVPIVKDILDKRETASSMANSIKLQSMFDDSGIVTAIRRQQPATAKDIQDLGKTLSQSLKEAAYVNSKMWKA